jgi:hypothetical protein
VDKIKSYIDSHYIGTPEALWHIFHFPVHEQHSTVICLQVSVTFLTSCNILISSVFKIYLPGQHMVLFDPKEQLDQIVEQAISEATTLTKFFKINSAQGKNGDEACKLTYQEFSQKFVWHVNKRWPLCKQGFAIRHMYFIPLMDGECFYL